MSVLLEPVFADVRTVGHDGHGVQVQNVFAVVDQFAKMVGVQEWLTAGEVGFLHASQGEEGKGSFGIWQGSNVAVCVGVKAEAAFIYTWSAVRLGADGVGQEGGCVVSSM